MPELAALQAWLQDAVLAGGAAPGAADRAIDGDARLPAAERVAIYARSYRGRLLDSLRSEYPALRALVGDTAFDLFAVSYLAVRPPSHFSLYALGAGFADHLAASAPAGEMMAMPAQLARLERARAEVQRAAGIERSGGRAVAAGLALAPGLVLRLPDSVRLLRQGFDFSGLIEAVDRGEGAVAPEPSETFVAVARNRYRVAVHVLDPWRYAWLEALGEDGAESQAAAALAARRTGRDVGPTLADLALWLPRAAELGLVV